MTRRLEDVAIRLVGRLLLFLVAEIEHSARAKAARL